MNTVIMSELFIEVMKCNTETYYSSIIQQYRDVYDTCIDCCIISTLFRATNKHTSILLYVYNSNTRTFHHSAVAYLLQAVPAFGAGAKIALCSQGPGTPVVSIKSLSGDRAVNTELRLRLALLIERVELPCNLYHMLYGSVAVHVY